MKAVIWKLLIRYFASEVSKLEFTAIDRYNYEQSSRSKQAKLTEIKQWLGKPVIVVSNIIDDPIVGFVTDYTELGYGGILVVFDYITCKEQLVFGRVLEYSEVLLEAISK